MSENYLCGVLLKQGRLELERKLDPELFRAIPFAGVKVVDAVGAAVLSWVDARSALARARDRLRDAEAREADALHEIGNCAEGFVEVRSAYFGEVERVKAEEGARNDAISRRAEAERQMKEFTEHKRIYGDSTLHSAVRKPQDPAEIVVPDVQGIDGEIKASYEHGISRLVEVCDSVLAVLQEADEARQGEASAVDAEAASRASLVRAVRDRLAAVEQEGRSVEAMLDEQRKRNVARIADARREIDEANAEIERLSGLVGEDGTATVAGDVHAEPPGEPGGNGDLDS